MNLFFYKGITTAGITFSQLQRLVTFSNSYRAMTALDVAKALFEAAMARVRLIVESDVGLDDADRVVVAGMRSDLLQACISYVLEWIKCRHVNYTDTLALVVSDPDANIDNHPEILDAQGLIDAQMEHLRMLHVARQACRADPEGLLINGPDDYFGDLESYHNPDDVFGDEVAIGVLGEAGDIVWNDEANNAGDNDEPDILVVNNGNNEN